MAAGKMYNATAKRFKRRVKMVKKGPKLSSRQKSEVKRLITNRQEIKHFDVASAAAQIDRGSQLTQLSTIPQGAGVSARVGDELLVKRLEFRFDGWYVIGATQSQHAFRLIIFRWNLDTGVSTPSLGSIIAGAATINDICAPYDFNAKNQGDFTVLYDKMYSLGSTAQGVVRQLNIPVNRKMDFDPGTTAASGHLYALLIGDDVTGAHTPDIQVQWQSRVFYTDA